MTALSFEAVRQLLCTFDSSCLVLLGFMFLIAVRIFVETNFIAKCNTSNEPWVRTVSVIKKRYSFEIRLWVVTEVLKYLVLETILSIVQYITLHLKSNVLCRKCFHVFLCNVVKWLGNKIDNFTLKVYFKRKRNVKGFKGKLWWKLFCTESWIFCLK